MKKSKQFNYPLHKDGFSKEDIDEGIKVLKSRQLTMSQRTLAFEKYFSKKFSAKYCLMVNSGSSANLLALSCATNPLRKNFLKKNDECLVPALCWSTTLWPVLQVGLKPKLIDVNIDNFSIDLKTIKKNISKKTKAIIIVNVLGNTSEIDKIKKFADKKKIILIEDNCESLGSKYKKKFLGTYGDFSSFSFYFSHQITCGEGGMIVCKNKEDYNILKSLRAHGWDRDIDKKNNKEFNFINLGFNLRPLEVSAAIALNQLKRFDKMIKIRNYNRNLIISSLKKSLLWNYQYKFFESTNKLKPSWFGLPLLLDKKFTNKKKNFIQFLHKNSLETRPIISGNFANQPSIKNLKIKINKKNLKNTQEIEERGFFIGLPTTKITQKDLKTLSKLLLNINNIK